jgi:DNA polymerase III epsilon subunit-like protein
VTSAPAPAPLCFIDTETTGLDRYTREIWEVAMIRREPDGSEQSYEVLVAGVDLSEASPVSLKIGRFYDRYDMRYSGNQGSPFMPAHPYLHPAHVAAAVERMTRGAHLVAAVPSFEDTGLAPLLKRHQLTPAWHYHLVCIENVLAGHLGVVPPYSPDELSDRIGVDPANFDRHTAMGDVLWVRAQWDAWQIEVVKRETL